MNFKCLYCSNPIRHFGRLPSKISKTAHTIKEMSCPNCHGKNNLLQVAQLLGLVKNRETQV